VRKTPFDAGKIINRAAGLIPTSVTFFDTNPTNLERMTDGDFTNETGEGIKSLSAPATIGIIAFDMGHAFPVLIIIHTNVHRTAGSDGYANLYVDESDDGTNWNSSVVSLTGGVSSDFYKSTCAGFLFARYFRLRYAAASVTVPSVFHVKIAEVQALQLL
jgi:hypothetical protein